MSNGESLKIA